MNCSCVASADGPAARAVQGRIHDKDGGVRIYSARLVLTLSPAGQIEPQIDSRSMVEMESQER